jgi:hypothetical protein
MAYNLFKQKKRLVVHRGNRFGELSKRLNRRIQSHVPKIFNSVTRAPNGVDWWKNIRGDENLVTVSLNKVTARYEKTSLLLHYIYVRICDQYCSVWCSHFSIVITKEMNIMFYLIVMNLGLKSWPLLKVAFNSLASVMKQ